MPLQAHLCFSLRVYSFPSSGKCWWISAANKKQKKNKAISCQLHNSRRCVFFLLIETGLYGTTISKKHLVQLRRALGFHLFFSGLLGIFPNASTGNHFIQCLKFEQVLSVHETVTPVSLKGFFHREHMLKTVQS